MTEHVLSRQYSQEELLRDSYSAALCSLQVRTTKLNDFSWLKHGFSPATISRSNLYLGLI